MSNDKTVASSDHVDHTYLGKLAVLRRHSTVIYGLKKIARQTRTVTLVAYPLSAYWILIFIYVLTGYKKLFTLLQFLFAPQLKKQLQLACSIASHLGQNHGC